MQLQLLHDCQVYLKIKSSFRSAIWVEMNSKSDLSRIFSPDVLETLRSPKLTFESELRWLYDFLPKLSGTFEDQINYQKWNPSWNGFEIRFVKDFHTWCARNPLLSETDFSDTAPMALRFPSWIFRDVWRSDQLSEAKPELEWIRNQVCPGFSYLMHSKPSAHDSGRSIWARLASVFCTYSN